MVRCSYTAVYTFYGKNDIGEDETRIDEPLTGTINARQIIIYTRVARKVVKLNHTIYTYAYTLTQISRGGNQSRIHGFYRHILLFCPPHDKVVL